MRRSETRSINARLSCTGQCDETWVRTQQAIPGLSIKVRGTDHDVVVAATRSAFARAMIGYVDRLGTWRAPALMVLTIGVPATCMLLLPKPDGWWSQVAVIVTLLAWLIISLLVIWPYFLAARPFVLVESVERPKTSKVARELVSRSRRRGRAWAIGSLAGVILVGLLVNGLYDALRAVCEALGGLIFRR